MSSFGEDLRTERLSRGIALKDITAVTKISHQYLEALEQERFRLLPGGILSKGIVRGYASAVGLDQCAWTERFLNAYVASGQMLDDDRSWMEFASNVGKDRIQRSDAAETRLRRIGVILLLLVGAAGVCLAVRYIGLRAGWWPTLLPAHLASVNFAVASMTEIYNSMRGLGLFLPASNEREYSFSYVDLIRTADSADRDHQGPTALVRSESLR